MWTEDGDSEADQRLRLRLQAARERVARNRRLEDEAGKDGEAGT
jgi:hypothetical protein